MKRTIQFCLFIWLSFFARNSYAQGAEMEIRKMLQLQQEAWNAGDIPAYMSGYWQHDSLAFIGVSTTTYGWKPVLDRYRKSYPDKATMGELTFSELSIHPLSKGEYFAIGKWHLSRNKGDVGGSFHLLYRNIKGKWLIVMDYTN
jgi:hypothetical protein